MSPLSLDNSDRGCLVSDGGFLGPDRGHLGTSRGRSDRRCVMGRTAGVLLRVVTWAVGDAMEYCVREQGLAGLREVGAGSVFEHW